MSVVIIGGNECMSHRYEQICGEYGCSAKVYTKEKGAIKKKIGSPDMLICFTGTVSHKMVNAAKSAAKKEAGVSKAEAFFGVENFGASTVIFNHCIWLEDVGSYLGTPSYL